MIKTIILMFLTASITGVLVPILILVMARLGYFEPIRLRGFGREWRFEPSPPKSLIPRSDASFIFGVINIAASNIIYYQTSNLPDSEESEVQGNPGVISSLSTQTNTSIFAYEAVS